MKRFIITASFLIAATSVAQATDVWKHFENDTTCRMQTGTGELGAFAVTFVKGRNLLLQLFKDKYAFPSKRMCGQADCPFISMTKISFESVDGRTPWISGWAETGFDVVKGQGGLEFAVLHSNAPSVLNNLSEAKRMTFDFVDGTPSWSTHLPGRDVFDSFADCVVRLGGIMETPIDRFVKRK